MYGATAGGKRGKDLSSVDLTAPELQAKPISLNKLETLTRFSRKELQAIYQGFKRVCPTGYANKNTFISVYQSFFPGRSSSGYAQLCFRVFDKEHSGELTFEQFARSLSQITRGSEMEKIDWIFDLYDLNGDGYITRSEVREVATAIFDLLRPKSENDRESTAIDERVDKMIETYDVDKDGRISKEEFVNVSSKDPQFIFNLNVFGTQL
ncbi:Kv channel-interacting protein 4 [Fasciola hepatica]|uniref:Kv channel-interacting protein 4 n=1 Tax=Fasciola hepatica TaxID=6192 RepID=A0A4E0RXR0_FASHE|nr:Kv channel-interacting protein 4 [Fasciola hepatica]